jgi:hypothetical protein
MQPAVVWPIIDGTGGHGRRAACAPSGDPFSRRVTRRLLILICLAAALACGAVTAAAQGGSKRQASGSLQATGTGTIVIRGQDLVAFGQVDPGTSIRVQDVAGNATVRVRDKAVALKNRVASVRNAGGGFYVRGSRVVLRISGPRVSISAVGRGKVSFQGVGTYRVNDAPEADWATAGLPFDLQPARRS